jgi:peptidoglycan/xylan/chitin deacetylase (PgdA/CDA1 family)
MRSVVRDVLVLCYHAVSGTSSDPRNISAGELETQLEFLVQRGYRSATFTEAATAPPHPKTLAVTFDDGYRSVLQAVPILSRLKLVATVFAVTNWPGRSEPMAWSGIDDWVGGPHEQELMSLSWDELGSLADRGWEIGSHSCSHPGLCEVDDAELFEELEASRRECEAHLARPCTSVAYPYGQVDARVIDAARMAGYTAGAALSWRLRRGSALDYPRVRSSGAETFEYWQQRVAPVKRWLVGSLVGDGLLRLERRLRSAKRR